MKIENIKPKCLVLGEVWDDFAKATDNVDFSQEDLACQVVSVVNVFYWLNTESVWGPMGFTWTKYNSTTKKGNGRFNKSNFTFNIIPRVPDSERHTSLNSIFYKINKSITFLDSGWSHITEVINLYNKTNNFTIIWHINSLNQEDTHIKSTYYEHYYFKGCLNKARVNVNNIDIYLEHKNKLLANITNRENNTNLYFKNDIDKDTSDLFDPLDYIICDYTNTYHYDSPDVVLLYFSKKYNFKKYKNYIICIGSRNYYNQSFNYQISSLYGTTNIIDEQILDLRSDIIDKKYGCGINIPIYSKKITYIGLNNTITMQSIYSYGYFEEIPRIYYWYYDIIKYKAIDGIHQGCIFSNCYFIGKYNYGKIKLNRNVFNNCYYRGEINKLPCYNLNSIYEVAINNYAYIADISNYMDFDIEILDEENAIYDLNIPYIIDNNAQLFILYKNIPNITIKNISSGYYFSYNTNTITYDCDVNVNYFKMLPQHEHSVILNKNYNIIIPNFNFNSIILKANSIILDVNKNNIIENKKYIDTTQLYFAYKNIDNNINLIYRSLSINLNISYFNTQNIDFDNHFFAYNVNVDASNPSISDNKVIKILNNIVTVGDIENSKTCTITLKSSIYNLLNTDYSETKNRLLGDGYTIIEQI